MFATVPREVIKLRFPFNSSSFMVSNSSKIWHPCVKSFCLIILAKLAFKTVGVLGVPTSLRDLRILDLGVSAIISVMNLLFVGVGGHLSSLSPSLVFNELIWSTAVPNMNWSSGVQTFIKQTKEITTLQLLIVRWEWCNTVWNLDQLVATAAENWALVTRIFIPVLILSSLCPISRAKQQNINFHTNALKLIDWDCHVYPCAHKHEVPFYGRDSLNALHIAFTLQLNTSNSSLQIH